MPFQISLTEEAENHLRALTAREQSLVEAAIQARLLHQATTATRAVKKLRPNPFAEWELRVGDLRVLYNVEVQEVVLLVIGRKAGNKLLVEGVEFHEHQEHPPEPPGNDTSGDAE